jgi:hypothetical protein
MQISCRIQRDRSACTTIELAADAAGQEEESMKNHFVITLIAALAAGCGAAPPAPIITEKPPAPASLSVAVGSTLIVEPPAAEYVHDLDARERREQIRDWAVLAAIGRFSTSPEQAAAATYELPPARLPYLDELYTFEYGRGRRAYLGNRVLLFRDADDPDPQTTIGRLADRVRMENGEIPGKVEVYLVDRRDNGQIAIERAPDVSGAALFSSEYGYVQGEGSDPEQLATWLTQSDDLSFAQITGDGRLVLGGRRFAHTRTANLTVEDVAALYQAHEELDKPRATARARLAGLPPQARAAAKKVAELAKAGKLTKDAQVPGIKSLELVVPEHQLRDVIMAAAMLDGPSRSPGFSLDPEWLPSLGNRKGPAMRDALRKFAVDPCGDLREMARRSNAVVASEPDRTRRTLRASLAETVKVASSDFDGACKQIEQRLASDIDQAAAALDDTRPEEWNSALIPYHKLKARLNDSNSPADVIAALALDVHEADSKVQCARYEGLAGTRAGMNLFYTDLIAKLWGGVDYGLSAPLLEIPGFQTMPRIDLPREFEEATRRNPNTRLWFGPRANGVSRVAAPGGPTFAFDHRFSRVYAAGNNPLRPGAEEQPAEESRRFLGWWDRHFDTVADYEPQYHLQNQIMKWTLITVALTESSGGRYLRTVDVPRNLQFAGWLRDNRTTLRFTDDLPTVHTIIPGRECIPVIASYPFWSTGNIHQISGGVSTVAREALATIEPIEITKPLGARRQYILDLGAGKAGTATRAHAVEDGARVTFADAEHARAIGPSGEIKLGTPIVEYERGATPTSLVIKARGDSPIGELSIESTPETPAPGKPQRIQLEFEAGEHEAEARSGTRMAVEDGDAAARNGKFTVAARIYEKAIPTARNADDVARLAEVDVARDRPAALMEKLQQLEHAPASAVANEALLQEIDKLETPAVARRVKATLTHKVPLNGNHEVVSVVDHELVVTRDLTAAEARPLHRAVPTVLSQDHVYIDGQIRAAHDGLLPDVGGYAARWHRVQGVRIEELDATQLGVLPDRIRMPGGKVFEHAARKPVQTSARSHPSRIFLIRQCSPSNDNDKDDKSGKNDKNTDRTRSTGHGC